MHLLNTKLDPRVDRDRMIIRTLKSKYRDTTSHVFSAIIRVRENKNRSDFEAASMILILHQNQEKSDDTNFGFWVVTHLILVDLNSPTRSFHSIDFHS